MQKKALLILSTIILALATGNIYQWQEKQEISTTLTKAKDTIKSYRQENGELKKKNKKWGERWEKKMDEQSLEQGFINHLLRMPIKRQNTLTLKRFINLIVIEQFWHQEKKGIRTIGGETFGKILDFAENTPISLHRTGEKQYKLFVLFPDFRKNNLSRKILRFELTAKISLTKNLFSASKIKSCDQLKKGELLEKFCNSTKKRYKKVSKTLEKIPFAPLILKGMTNCLENPNSCEIDP